MFFERPNIRVPFVVCSIALETRRSAVIFKGIFCLKIVSTFLAQMVFGLSGGSIVVKCKWANQGPVN